MAIRVLIADDEELIRTGFGMILGAAEDIEVVGEAADGGAAVDQALVTHPDVVLMDIRMPRLDGIEATRRIRGRADCDAQVVILTTFGVDEYVYAALAAGASGFLLKDGPAQELIDAVRVVARGDALLSPAITRRLIERFARQTSPRAGLREQLAELTPRELEVLELLAHGLSNGEIAARLVVGEATVKTHVGRVLMKLGVRDRTQAVVFAYEAGVVEPGGGQAAGGSSAGMRPT
jgi:DNA-binding NarL/FixJ family response regulator